MVHQVYPITELEIQGFVRGSQFRGAGDQGNCAEAWIHARTSCGFGEVLIHLDRDGIKPETFGFLGFTQSVVKSSAERVVIWSFARPRKRPAAQEQRTEGRGQRTEGRGQRAEDRGRKTVVGSR